MTRLEVSLREIDVARSSDVCLKLMTWGMFILVEINQLKLKLKYIYQNEYALLQLLFSWGHFIFTYITGR